MEIMDSTQVINENFKQKVLRKLYPLIRKMGKKGKNGTVLINEQKKVPVSSFYDLKAVLNSGKTIDFSGLKGKKVVLVNTASNCGYTGQYSELQSLHERYGDTLQIIAFPANDFAGQEKSNDHEIAQFCRLNYGVTFPVVKKGVVAKSAEQQHVFRWLSDKNMNGWNEHDPDWNFGKYIIDEKGVLTHYFGPSVSPLEEDFLKALE
ncbi:MAG: glutathione peroxidase [Bacteroidales bacterium]|nr:glutathione peroxidase [Bacteroidales bacterium]